MRWGQGRREKMMKRNIIDGSSELVLASEEVINIARFPLHIMFERGWLGKVLVSILHVLLGMGLGLQIAHLMPMS